MKNLFILFFISFITSNTFAQNGQAQTIKKTFSRETSISIAINSDPSTIWALLTNANDYTRWNSTVTQIEGNIALGEKIKLKSVLDSKRTFKLKVKEFEPNNKMVWGDGQGKRTYLIQKNQSGSTTFSMTEKIGGLMFPMYAKMIPPFDQTFEQFANDLKKAAENITYKN